MTVERLPREDVIWRFNQLSDADRAQAIRELTRPESITMLELKRIRRDGGTQMRVVLNELRAEWLSEVYLAAGHFKKPVIVYYDGTHHWLADGFTRCRAVELAKGLKGYIEAEVRAGTVLDAQMYACTANSQQGEAFSERDTHRVVNFVLDQIDGGKLAVKEWPLGRIAQHCGVKEGFVRRLTWERNPPEVPREPLPGSDPSRRATRKPVGERLAVKPPAKVTRNATPIADDHVPVSWDGANTLVVSGLRCQIYANRGHALRTTTSAHVILDAFRRAGWPVAVEVLGLDPATIRQVCRRLTKRLSPPLLTFASSDRLVRVTHHPGS
jgi:hypothetical protein